MKIAIIGASGRAGSLIAKELLDRGHEVTGYVMHPEKVKDERIKVIRKSIFELSEADLKDYDVVVNAFGQFAPGLGFQYQTSTQSLIHAMKNLPEVRLLFVGGAASLYTDPEKQHMAIERIPEKFREVPSNMYAELEMLRKSDINWTFFSPAFTFDAAGPRTGSYTLGTDFIFNNDEGESYISYADYAIAMADEVEKGQFAGGHRFTAVSNRNPKAAEPEAEEKVLTRLSEELAGDDLTLVSSETLLGSEEGEPGAPEAATEEDKKPEGKEFPDVEFEGVVSQYRAPLVYELAGKSFHLILDNGEEGALIFHTGRLLTWSLVGGESWTERYECNKIDEDTYLVVFEITNSKPRTGITFILDMEQSLVTEVLAYQGTNRKYPDMVYNDFVFGAIALDNRPLPKKRHGFTDALMGTRIIWRYYANAERGIPHVYADPNYMRLPLPPEDDHSPMAEAMRANPYDEPARFIKIKENIYAASFLEQHHTERGGIGNNMLVCLDIARLKNIGRSFGLHRDHTPENYIFNAYGKWMDAGENDRYQSVYRV